MNKDEKIKKAEELIAEANKLLEEVKKDNYFSRPNEMSDPITYDKFCYTATI